MLPSHYIKIHDHGFVGLVDHMGSDAAIVEAARVSYQTGTKATRTDRALIRYLMRHKHTSPMEMCEVKLHIRAPIFVLRQWIRHRTASVNEESGRYSEIREMFFSPELDDLAPQSLDNKQA
jgi:thymidylate synthase (FAD)